MEFIVFGASDNANVFAALSPEELDNISFGVMQINSKGRILLLNRAESEITGHAQAAAIGKNFFTEVAICTDTPEFRGRFDEGVRLGNLNVVFEWFLPGATEHAVQVHLKAANAEDKYWIFTKRL